MEKKYFGAFWDGILKGVNDESYFKCEEWFVLHGPSNWRRSDCRVREITEDQYNNFLNRFDIIKIKRSC